MQHLQNLITQLKAEKLRLEKQIKETEKRLAKAPEGTVRVVDCHGYFQFFLRTGPEDKTGLYIPAAEKSRIRALLQKKYDVKLRKAAAKQLAAIDRFLKQFDPDAPDKVYLSLAPGTRELLMAAELPDDIHAEKWQSEPYNQKPVPQDQPEHFTQRGERVRSKSEVLIADALHRAGVPYRYECPVDLGGTVIHPDFTILRRRDRKEIYLEHLGMLDENGYRNDALARLRLYEKNGIVLGDRLFITAESYRQPLNLSSITTLIHRAF